MTSNTEQTNSLTTLNGCYVRCDYTLTFIVSFGQHDITNSEIVSEDTVDAFSEDNTTGNSVVELMDRVMTFITYPNNTVKYDYKIIPDNFIMPLLKEKILNHNKLALDKYKNNNKSISHIKLHYDSIEVYKNGAWQQVSIKNKQNYKMI